MYYVKLLATIIIPPLGVFLTVGLRGAFWLNILLTLFFYIPGFIHGAYVLARALPRHAQKGAPNGTPLIS